MTITPNRDKTFHIVYAPSSKWILNGRYNSPEEAFQLLDHIPGDLLTYETWPSGKVSGCWYGGNINE